LEPKLTLERRHYNYFIFTDFGRSVSEICWL